MSDTSKKEFKRSFSGYVEICEKMPTGMITVRGDLNSRKLKSAFSKVVGATLPKERKVTLAENSIAWMSPDELLIICGYDNVSDLMKKLQKELDGQHHMLVNVSDARAVFEVSGAAMVEIIAKLAPVNVKTLEIGEIRRTHISQVAAAFWLTSEQSMKLICFSSVADYMFDLLKTSAVVSSKVGEF
ncbi:MAG: sarcosine oxidase subunit gamma family protein [Paracoccaceae bacterium]